MLEPIDKVTRQAFRAAEVKERIVCQRQLPDPLQGIGIFLDSAIESVLGQTRCPGLTEPLFKGATLVSPPIVVVGSRNHRKDACQMRRLGESGQHLGSTHVGGSKHSHLPVCIRQGRGPLYRLEAILRFVQKRVPLALGSVASADILDDDDIPASGSLKFKV